MTPGRFALALLLLLPACADDGGTDDEMVLDDGGESSSGGEERSACAEALECALDDCADEWAAFYAEACDERCPGGACEEPCVEPHAARSECMEACGYEEVGDVLWTASLACMDPEGTPSECEAATATCESAE